VPFSVIPLSLPEVILLEPTIFRDERGVFFECYRESDVSRLGIREKFPQDNCSRSAKNVLRGLHYQSSPKAQGKLVRCSKGAIFDVCVDIRKNSPTFSQWLSAELTEDNCRLLYVPPGFAHGFVALTEGAEVLYKCTAEYSKEHDRGILWSDPAIGIRWPVQNPLLSEKDRRNPPLRDAQL